ncbi:hypothetical protein BDZ45DRAFT_234486 [Acephala macrosclerotiorum]|nr:hypothetical protein BDZ45DRAFT_234486 [Acephala macrosclerotiorum]
MALPDQTDRCRLPSRNDEHPHWFQTMRGFMALLNNHWSQLAEGPFAPLVQGEINDQNHAPENPNDEQLANPPWDILLRQLMINPTVKKEALRPEKSLGRLRQVAGLSYSSSISGETSIRYWVGSVDHEFAELVYERDPRALVVLIHYCVLLNRFDHVWYLESLGTGLLGNIGQALAEE